MSYDKKQRVTLFINPSLLKHAKAQAMVKEISLTLLMEKALSKYLPKETIIKKVPRKLYFLKIKKGLESIKLRLIN